MVKLAIGWAAVVLSMVALWTAYRRGPTQKPYPWRGWIGWLGFAGTGLLWLFDVSWIRLLLTPLLWTAYILVIDAAVEAKKGRSLLGRPASLVAMALLSIPAWLIFEAYNLRLGNWIYVGVAPNFWVYLLGAGWAFATIYPGIFETAALLDATWVCRRRRISRALLLGWGAAGAIFLLLPLLIPSRLAPYLFGLVWLGFILLLEPVNYLLRWPSLLRDWESGRGGRTVSLLLAGLICGFFWESWNYGATAHWEYVFPLGQHLKIFEMPLPGFLGFPAFALECFAMLTFFSRLLLPAALWPEI